MGIRRENNNTNDLSKRIVKIIALLLIIILLYVLLMKYFSNESKIFQNKYQKYEYSEIVFGIFQDDFIQFFGQSRGIYYECMTNDDYLDQTYTIFSNGVAFKEINVTKRMFEKVVYSDPLVGKGSIRNITNNPIDESKSRFTSEYIGISNKLAVAKTFSNDISTYEKYRLERYAYAQFKKEQKKFEELNNDYRIDNIQDIEISTVEVGDINADGDKEYIYSAMMRFDLLSEDRVYNYAFAGSFITKFDMFQQVRPLLTRMSETTSDIRLRNDELISAIDIDGDGVLELVFRVGIYEMSWYEIYALNGETYALVYKSTIDGCIEK